MHLWRQQSAIIWVNSCSSNKNSCGHTVLHFLMYSLCFLKFGIILDENIWTLWFLLYGKVICELINCSYYNLSGYKFTNVFSHYNFFGRMYSSGKFLESPIEIKHLLLYIWVVQFYERALSGPVSFCSVQGIRIVDVERKKRRWSRIGRIKYCVENCDWALQETFVWLKHLRIQALFFFLIYNDSSRLQMSHALHAPPRLSFCDSPRCRRNIVHRIQIAFSFPEN